QLIVAATPSSKKVGGESAVATWLNTMLTNNIDKLDIGMGQYTFLLNERGGVIDDLIAYRIGEQKFLLVVNAARTDDDFTWLENHLKDGRSPDLACGGLEPGDPCNLTNRSTDFGGVEIQDLLFVDLTKRSFMGRDVLRRAKENGTAEKLVPFRMKQKGPPPRPHYAVFQNGERIGEVTSGTISPSLNWGVGMAYVSSAHAKIGTE